MFFSPRRVVRIFRVARALRLSVKWRRISTLLNLLHVASPYVAYMALLLARPVAISRLGYLQRALLTP